MFSKRWWKKTLPAVLMAGSMGLLAACGGGGTDDPGTSGSNGSSDEVTEGPTLVVFAGSQTPIVANFNPYSPTALPGTSGSIYEPLVYYNKAEATDPIPFLAESYGWAEDGMSLDITIRDGVTWSDGEDFTVDDVVFSFTNDAVGIEYLDGAEAVDDSTVRLTFNTPAYTNKYALLGATYMVPEHVFGEVDDLVTFANDTDPVGTGPFKVSSVTEASYTVIKNENYWDPERPSINEVQYLGIDGNASAEALFQAGELDYSTMFIPNPDTVLSTGRLGYLLTMSPNPLVILVCSNADLGCDGAQTDVAVRQAFSLSLDRTDINDRAYYGLATIGTPTYTMPGRDDHWIPEGLPTRNPEGPDVEAARKVLEDAGYTEGADGIYEKDGQRASFDLISVEGWADANAGAELAAANALEAGIEVNVSTVTLDQYTELRQIGDYDMIWSALFGTATSDPYTIYRNSFTTEYTTPVGTPLEPTQTNFARYSNPIVDEAVAEAGATNDDAVKAEAYGRIMEELVRDVPYIPLYHGGSQTFYNQEDFEGWPTENDMYAFPASWDGMQSAYVMSRLTYK